MRKLYIDFDGVILDTIAKTYKVMEEENIDIKNEEQVINAVIEDWNASHIEKYAFYNCTGLTSVTISDSVTIIGGGAFYDCSNLETVTVSDSVVSIGKYAFCRCRNLTLITMSDNITRIQESTFDNCNNLTTITIPKRVANIEDRAFNGCYNLRNVISLAVLPPTLGEEIFSATAILTIPSHSLGYYMSTASKWKQYFVSIEEMSSDITIPII